MGSIRPGAGPRTTGGLTGGGLFLGDYSGLATAGRDFLAFFPVTGGVDPASIAFRRVGPASQLIENIWVDWIETSPIRSCWHRAHGALLQPDRPRPRP